MGKLLVYSASAGSGKTHNIAGQYLLMLFSKPKAYRNILAVTFTNKACEEMKSRIISELAAIINEDPGNRISEIASHTHLSKEMVKIRAKQIFTEMLHDYSFFSVSTIDSFFQKILRNFTRETGIQYNYEIELDTESVINTAVDILLESTNTNPELKKNIISLVDQKMENLSKWDFRRDLKSFLKKVIESDYRTYEAEYDAFFSDKNKVNEFKKSLSKIEHSFRAEIKSFCSEIQSVLDSHNLSIENFKGGKTSSIPKRLLKTHKLLIDNDAIDIEAHFNKIEDIENWLAKANINKEPETTAANQMMVISTKMKKFFELNYYEYNTAEIIKNHFNYATLINDGLKTIHTYLNEEGKFLISEVPVFLSEIAKQNSSSFIYEKTGNFYENYLIDEFQDTSAIQWNSFYPLVLESLSSGNEDDINILVGDVKQSIYAWRGGDWRLLAYKVKQEFENYYIEKSLIDNWRSGKIIVEFNNDFFEAAAISLSDSVKNSYPEKLAPLTGDLITNSIYSNIKQNYKKDFKSIVKVSVFDKPKDKHEEQPVNFLIIERMIKQIEELQENNHKPGEIMILVRSNIDGSRIAQQIIEYSQSDQAKKGIVYDVISADALFVSSNKAVQLIISCLKYLNDENNKLAFTETAYIYYSETVVNTQSSNEFNRNQFIALIQQKIDSLKENHKHKLLHDLVEIIVVTLELGNKSENIPFLNSFRDIVHDFGLKHPSEIESFLEFWDETGAKQNLKIPEKQNAINIISIHKSKGLAADFVFIPFCDWDLYKYSDMIWAGTNQKPFDTLPVWPVNFNKSISNSCFEDNFYFHKFRQTVESFNMMYVAFTRARKGLFISTIKETDNNFSKVSTVLRSVIENPAFIDKQKPTITEFEEFRCKEYSLGEIETVKKNDNVDGYFNEYPVFIPEKKIKIRSFFDRDKVDTSSQSMVHKGIVYHKIFEKINTGKDIPKAVNELAVNGLIKNNDCSIYENEISSLISLDFVCKWFDGSYTIMNEAEIITSKGKIKRPDRIMESDNEIIIIDYKFGFNEDSKYIKQTREYGNLLYELEKKKVKIYIWYVLSGYLIEVSIDSDESKKIIL